MTYGMRPARILLADNDKDFLDIWKDYIQEQGHRVILADSYQKAKALLKKGCLELAILDLRLKCDDDPSDTSGLELAREFAHHIPKLIITRANDNLTVLKISRNQARSPALKNEIEFTNHVINEINVILKELEPLVFLGYKREDEAQAEKIYHLMMQKGFRPFIDKASLEAGIWDREIKKAILYQTEIFMPIISKTTLPASGYFKKEINLAMDVRDVRGHGNYEIIPVRLEDCNFKRSPLGNFQWVDYWRPGGKDELIKKTGEWLHKNYKKAR